MAKTRIALIQMKMSSDLQKNMNSAIKKITNKSISHFRKCSDPEDKDHNLHLGDAIKLDILMQSKLLGTPLLNNFELN